MECECAQQLSLWKTPKPVDNSSDDAMSLLKDKSLSSAREAELVTALLHRIDILDARLESLEFQLIEVLGLVDQPLTREQLIYRLRELREAFRAETPP